jgi:hypothetical protein
MPALLVACRHAPAATGLFGIHRSITREKITGISGFHSVCTALCPVPPRAGGAGAGILLKNGMNRMKNQYLSDFLYAACITGPAAAAG